MRPAPALNRAVYAALLESVTERALKKNEETCRSEGDSVDSIEEGALNAGTHDARNPGGRK
jgi:hypothetical protein